MDVMLDLETLGNRAGCVVLSIGAVPFNSETGDVHSTGFYADLELNSQLDQHLRIDSSTVLWWLRQADQLRIKQADAQRQHPGIVLDNFRDWYKAMKGAAIWANGATFVMPILEALYAAYGLPMPWGYRDSRCVRTLFAIAGSKLGDFGTVNNAQHDALGDALYQAREVTKCIQALKGIVTHGRQRLAEIATAESKLARERQDGNANIQPCQVSDAEASRRRDSDEAPATAGNRAPNGQGAGEEGEDRQTFLRKIEAEHSPTAEERAAEASLYGHEIVHGGYGT